MASTSPDEPPPREDWRLVVAVAVEEEEAAASLLLVGVQTPRAELRLRLVNRLMVSERW